MTESDRMAKLVRQRSHSAEVEAAVVVAGALAIVKWQGFVAELLRESSRILVSLAGSR